MYDEKLNFNSIKGGFNEIDHDIQFSFEEYKEFKKKLKSDIVFSSGCNDFYPYIMKYIKDCLDNSNNLYQIAVFKYKLDDKLNESSSTDFKYYVKNCKKKYWIEKRYHEERSSYTTGSDNSYENDDTNHSTMRSRKNSKVVSMKDKKEEFIKVGKRYKLKIDDDQRIWGFQRFIYGQSRSWLKIW